MSDWSTEDKLALAMQRVRQLDANVFMWKQIAFKSQEFLRHLRACATCGYDWNECETGKEILIHLTETEMKRNLGPEV